VSVQLAVGVNVGTAVPVDDRLRVAVRVRLGEAVWVALPENVPVVVHDAEGLEAIRAVSVLVRVRVSDSVRDSTEVIVAVLVYEPGDDEVLDGVAVGAGVEVRSLVKVIVALDDKVGTSVGVGEQDALLVPDLVPVAVQVDCSVREEDDD